MNCDAISYLCLVATIVALENFRFSCKAQYAIRVSPDVHSNARRFFFVALPLDGSGVRTRRPTVFGHAGRVTLPSVATARPVTSRTVCQRSMPRSFPQNTRIIPKPPRPNQARRFRSAGYSRRARPPAAEIVTIPSSQTRRRRLPCHHAKSEQGHRCAPA